jgi:hypothetical protein
MSIREEENKSFFREKLQSAERIAHRAEQKAARPYFASSNWPGENRPWFPKAECIKQNCKIKD